MTTPGWQTDTIEGCLIPISLGHLPKLQTKGYKQHGTYPIIDQGQDLIAGWTNDSTGLISDGLPFIVFGDHTRALKYVDFPFVRGADGTQILKPREGIDPLYFYYACLAVDLPSRGYNRHFSAFRESEIGLPQNEEQIAIAKIMRNIERYRNLQWKQIGTAQLAKTAAMQALFTQGLSGELQKETEIGLAPESWAFKPIRAHFAVGSGGTPSRTNPEYWQDGTIPWVKTNEVSYCVIHKTSEQITKVGLAESAARLLPAGTLLLAMYGQGVTRGKVAILGIEAACNQACATINPKDDVIAPKYLYHFLTYRYEEIRKLAHGGQQQNLNLDIVRDLPITFPLSKDEQCRMIATLDAIDGKIDLHRRQLAVLDDLFKAMLQKLMTGEIRVGQLDLSALSPAAPANIAA
jgi:type I restriction enzyme S subunit